MKENTTKNETVSVDEFKIERNSMGLSIVSNFNACYDYLFDYDILKNTTTQIIDISLNTDEEKLNLFDDCQSVLTDLRSYFLYTEDLFDEYTLDTIKKKYIDVLGFLILLKPEIKEDEYLNKRSVRNLFDNAFKSVQPIIKKTATKNTLNENFHKTLVLLNQEYELKANFYTAAENKDKENSKHYTEETWFKVGLKYADGTIYNLKADDPKLSKNKISIRIFGLENKKTFQPMLSQSFDGYKHYKKGYYDKDNIYNRSTSKEELKKVYNYCIENNIPLNSKFIENYLLVQKS